MRLRVPSSGYWDAREALLSPPLANETLGLWATLRAATRLSGDPRDLRLFGMGTLSWYARGVRILGRSAVEVTRDPQASFLAEAAAGTLREHGYRIRDVIDPFVGSGNLLYHVLRATTAERGVGIDVNPPIVEQTRKNFARVQQLGRLDHATVEIFEGDWTQSIGRAYPGPTLIVVMPPWGAAYTDQGLDLRETTPPVPEILSEFGTCGGDAPLFALVHTAPQLVVESLDEIVRAYRAFETVKADDPQIASRLDYVLVQLR